MSEKSYTFNWHDLDRFEPYEKFLQWVIVHLVVDQKDVDAGQHNGELIKKLSVATDGFTDVALTVQVNGVEVDPEHWLRALEHNMKQYARDAARAELTQLTSFQTLRTSITGFERSAVTKLNELADALGLDPIDEEDDL